MFQNLDISIKSKYSCAKNAENPEEPTNPPPKDDKPVDKQSYGFLSILFTWYYKFINIKIKKY